MIRQCRGITLVVGLAPFFVLADNVPLEVRGGGLEADLGKGCHIAMKLPDNAKGKSGGEPKSGLGGLSVEPLPKSWGFKSFPSLYFHLVCRDVDKVVINNASFDLKTKTWKKDVSKRIKSLGFEVSQKEYKYLYDDFDKAILFYNVATVNSKGFASTEKETTGDDIKRRRLMGFCLFHPPKALCGSGTVGMVADGPKSDLSKKVLEILRTVEFLPD